ncbi:MAG: L,D-transpeptidase family protein [Terrimicrobiaceae bacterium]|nr:L,D-transpeptidase family protein [Terrimicrobiaceae bacterium]
MRIKNFLVLFSFMAVAVLAGTGCADYDTRLTNPKTTYLGGGADVISRGKASTLADANSYWDGDGAPGAPSVVINLTEQTASFYKGGKLVGVSAISSGREGHETPTGNYRIIDKDLTHASNLYGDYVDAQGVVVKANVAVKVDPIPPGAKFRGASMPYFMHFAPGVGMHQGFLPGVPDSHGCIRMPEHMAKIYFANVQKGTPVQVIR